MREEERALSGLLFCPADPELRALKAKAHRLSHEYNDTYEEETGRRSEILSELVGELGENAFMQGPIQFHYGCHTRIGKNFFANFNFTVQDDCWVTIGDNCAFGPGVTLVTPVHPMLPDERRLMLDGEGNKRRLCYAKSVTVGNDCWLGANVTVCSGAVIGDGCVIGAGSVVTGTIPPHTFAAGVPCRPIRTLTEKDSMKYKTEILGGCAVIEEEK